MSKYIKSGSKVTFKKDYNGYFIEQKGKPLTVDVIWLKPDNSGYVTFKEFSFIHRVELKDIKLFKKGI